MLTFQQKYSESSSFITDINEIYIYVTDARSLFESNWVTRLYAKNKIRQWMLDLHVNHYI